MPKVFVSVLTLLVYLKVDGFSAEQRALLENKRHELASERHDVEQHQLRIKLTDEYVRKFLEMPAKETKRRIEYLEYIGAAASDAAIKTWVEQKLRELKVELDQLKTTQKAKIKLHEKLSSEIAEIETLNRKRRRKLASLPKRRRAAELEALSAADQDRQSKENELEKTRYEKEVLDAQMWKNPPPNLAVCAIRLRGSPPPKPIVRNTPGKSNKPVAAEVRRWCAPLCKENRSCYEFKIWINGSSQGTISVDSPTTTSRNSDNFK